MKNLLVFILLFLLIVGVEITIGCFFASWLCDIDPSRTYHWTGGIWHGLFFLPNLVRSFFTDALFKAENYTVAYNIFWWINAILSSLAIIMGGKRRGE